MNLDDKLKQFLDVTSGDARAKSANEVSEYKEKMAKSFEEYKKTAEEKASSQHEVTVATALRENSTKVTKHIADKRKELQDRQAELKSELIGQVRDMLIDFKKTDEYSAYLIECVKKAGNIAGDSQFTVFIDKSDEAYLETVRAFAKENTKAEVYISEELFVGGIRADIPVRNIILDESFATKLSEEEQKIIF